MKVCTLLCFFVLLSGDSASAYDCSKYLPPSPYAEMVDEKNDSNSAAEIKNGISVLKDYLFSFNDLPLCVEIEIQDQNVKATLDRAIKRWNDASLAVLQKTVFDDHCEAKKSRVKIVSTSKSGVADDGEIKFGEVFNLKTKPASILLLLREKEMQEYNSLLTSMRDQKIKKDKMSVA
jgi:hypothetical protein